MFIDEKILDFKTSELFEEIVSQMHTLWINNKNRQIRNGNEGFSNMGVSDLVEYLNDLVVWLRDSEKSLPWLQENLEKYTTGEFFYYKESYSKEHYIELPDEFYEDLLILLFPNLV